MVSDIWIYLFNNVTNFYNGESNGISKREGRWRKDKTILFAIVGTEVHQHRLEICTVCGSIVSVLKNDRAVPNIFALN